MEDAHDAELLLAWRLGYDSPRRGESNRLALITKAH